MTFERLREVFGKLFRALKQAKRTKAAVALDTFTTEAVDGNEAAHALAEAYHLATYEFPGYKQKKSEPDYQLESLIVYTAAEAAEIEASLFVGSVYGKATNSARTLVNTPGNLLTASDLADYAVKLANRYDFDYEVLEKEDMEAARHGSAFRPSIKARNSRPN